MRDRTKTIHGVRLGILCLETSFPRIVGDAGNAQTWPFPVLFKIVRGATAQLVVHEKGRGLNSAFLQAAEELVSDGADGITTTGGFLSVFQKELAAHAGVPVASSSLMQVPLAQALLAPGKRVGVITIHGQRLSADHLTAAGAPADTPIVGTESGTEITRVMLEGRPELDFAKAEADVLGAGREMLERHPDVGSLVLECHNMAPYSARLQKELRVPIFDVYTFVKWFHSGLAPRDFGNGVRADQRWE